MTSSTDTLVIPAYLVAAAMDCQLNAHHRLIGIEAEKGFAPSVATVYHRLLLARLQIAGICDRQEENYPEEPYTAESAITWDKTTPNWQTLNLLVNSRYHEMLERMPYGFNKETEFSCTFPMAGKKIELVATADGYIEKGPVGVPEIDLLRTSTQPPDENMFPTISLFHLIAKVSGNPSPLVNVRWYPRNKSKKANLQYNSALIPGRSMGIERVISRMVANIVEDEKDIQTNPGCRRCYSCPVREQALCPAYPMADPAGPIYGSIRALRPLRFEDA